MLRIVCLCVSILAPQAINAQPDQLTARVWQVMDMDSLVPVLRDEAMAEAEGMSETLFQRGGTGEWLDQVARIHDPERMETLFLEGLDTALPGMNAARISEALDFYETDLGRRLVTLETSARVAFADKATEEDARGAFARAVEADEPRVGQIQRMIDSADLIAPNVAGGLNAVIAFSSGFNDGGGYPMPMAESEILAEAWAQEAQIELDTENWLQAYLLMAYSPLGDDELETYIEFSASSEGQALSGLLFAGFDRLFRQTSYDLGLAAAGQLSGRQL